MGTSPELPLLLSPLSEELTPELDVTSPTLLEPSMSPRGRLRLMPTTWEDTELDSLVWDSLDSDTLDSDTPVWDTPVWDTMLLATPVSLPLPLHRRSCPCCCPRHRRTLRRSWTLRRQH